MSEQEFNRIFAKNLSTYLYLNHMTQLELAEKMNVSTATVSNWCKGIKLPRMDKVDRICNILQIKRSALMEENITPKDEREIKNILANTEELLQQNGLMFEGQPASPEAIDSILSAMQIGMEMAKKRNKEKYTPNKYKKE